VTSADAQAAYNSWKTTFLANDCGYRIRSDDGSNSKSEGIGYGMILTAYYGEKTYFDGLLAFYKSKRTSSSKNLMGWLAPCSGWADQGSATDGDLDVAYALLVI
jgi:endo-1,4-beta-D-glucanase Y